MDMRLGTNIVIKINTPSAAGKQEERPGACASAAISVAGQTSRIKRARCHQMADKQQEKVAAPCWTYCFAAIEDSPLLFAAAAAACCTVLGRGGGRAAGGKQNIVGRRRLLFRAAAQQQPPARHALQLPQALGRTLSSMAEVGGMSCWRAAEGHRQRRCQRRQLQAAAAAEPCLDR